MQVSTSNNKLSEMFGEPPSFKNDNYRRVRGGTSTFLSLFCSRCDSWLLLYQKDGEGKLMRCYLNRIFAPSSLEELQNNPNIKDPKDLLSLKCLHCNNIIGHPIRHRDGRLSFRLIQGSFKKKKGIVEFCV
jgi:hypothetical protein